MLDQNLLFLAKGYFSMQKLSCGHTGNFRVPYRVNVFVKLYNMFDFAILVHHCAYDVADMYGHSKIFVE